MARPTRDLKHLTGSPWDEMEDISDRPDSLRMDEMRQRLIDRINAMPGNSASFAEWSTPNSSGISDEMLYGPAHEQRDGLDDDQRQLIYESVARQFESLSGPQIEALDQRDMQRAQQANTLWSEFEARFPELAKDSERVEVAIALHDDELRSYGQNPDIIRRDDPTGYVRGVAEAAGYVESNIRTTHDDLGLEDSGRDVGLSYGGSVARHAFATERPSKGNDPAGSMRNELIEQQRKLGLW
jgi:hypothetical protein